jgi:hypothetical protein
MSSLRILRREPEPQPEPEPYIEPVPEPLVDDVVVEEVDQGQYEVSIDVPAPPEPEPESAPQPAAPAKSNADELFARLRAEQDQLPGVEDEPVAEAQHAPVEDADAAPRPVANEEELLLQRRDAAVEAIEASLARRLKRLLQDDQNEVLDRLRSRGGRRSSIDVLPPEDEQLSRFAHAGRPHLEEAARAGAGFAAPWSPGSPPDPSLPELDDVVDELAGAIVTPLRRRLERAFEDTADEEPSVVAERLGAAYREWKTQRIEQAAADHVAGAFARGAFEAVPAGRPLRWVVDDVDGPCPDCDDNALAGATPRGQVFPTGQQHPPAHAGCRCLLLPAGEG